MDRNPIPKIDVESLEPKPAPRLSFKLPILSGKAPKIALGITVFFIILILAILIPGLFIYKDAIALAKSGKALVESAERQDVSKMKSDLGLVKSDLKNLKRSFTFISWTKFIPFIGLYVSDAQHALTGGEAAVEATEIVLTSVDPYAEILGFGKGKSEAKDGAKTTQERIDFVLATIPDLLPKIDLISAKMDTVKREFDQIDADRYPEKFKGYEVRKTIVQGKTLIDQAATFTKEGKPLLASTPYLLGVDSPRTYLVIFQNDKELRPTGGFMTAYSIMKVDKARFEPVSSNDIYNLDAKYKATVPAPEPIVKYLKGPYALSKNFRLRDMNWSPDFSESMKLVTDEAKSVGITEIDGVIGVDTQLLVNLLNAIGQIGVPGFGNFSTKEVPECKCPQVIHELESFADIEGPVVWDPGGSGKIIYAPPNYENRKKIVGPLMNSILANTLGQPKEKLPALFDAAFRSIQEKHILIFLFDEKAQKAVEEFGIGGTVEDYDGDYLYINDANLGGRKSNLYVTQEVEQEISTGRGKDTEKTVTITYKNPEKYDGWLNSVLPNWVRVYVPKGSQLIAAEGLEEKAEPYEEFGKTVFAGFFQLRPEGVSKVTFKYRLPFKANRDYKLFIQKQPGTDKPLYRVNLGRHEEEFFLKTDKEFKTRI